MILANSFTWANEFYLIAFTVSFLLLMMTKGLVIFGGVLLTFATGCVPRVELSPSTPVAYHTEAPHMCRKGKEKATPRLEGWL